MDWELCSQHLTSGYIPVAMIAWIFVTAISYPSPSLVHLYPTEIRSGFHCSGGLPG